MESVKSVVGGIADKLNEWAEVIMSAILIMLPDSPFKDLAIPPEMADLMGYLNYYIPFGAMKAIALGWVSCIVIFYAYQQILRMINAIR